MHLGALDKLNHPLTRNPSACECSSSSEGIRLPAYGGALSDSIFVEVEQLKCGGSENDRKRHEKTEPRCFFSGYAERNRCSNCRARSADSRHNCKRLRAIQ